MQFAIIENEDKIPQPAIQEALDGFELELDVVGEDGEEHEVKVRLSTAATAESGDAHQTVAFRVTGRFRTPKTLAPFYDVQGNIVGFRLADGRAVQLVVGLEVAVDAEESKYEYLTDCDKMAAVGFEMLDYDEAQFEIADS